MLELIGPRLIWPLLSDLLFEFLWGPCNLVRWHNCCLIKILNVLIDVEVSHTALVMNDFGCGWNNRCWVIHTNQGHFWMIVSAYSSIGNVLLVIATCTSRFFGRTTWCLGGLRLLWMICHTNRVDLLPVWVGSSIMLEAIIELIVGTHHANRCNSPMVTRSLHLLLLESY